MGSGPTARYLPGMYELALMVHNVLRLVVVVVTLIVVLSAVRGWLGSKPWASGDRTGLLVLTILVDIQLLIGILLHLVWSPLTKQAFQDMGAAMKDGSVRKFVVEHPVMMLAAIALVHVAKVAAKKTTNDASRHRRTAILVGIALVLFVFGTAWPWTDAARPWLRLGL